MRPIGYNKSVFTISWIIIDKKRRRKYFLKFQFPLCLVQMFWFDAVTYIWKKGSVLGGYNYLSTVQKLVESEKPTFQMFQGITF